MDFMYNLPYRRYVRMGLFPLRRIRLWNSGSYRMDFMRSLCHCLYNLPYRMYLMRNSGILRMDWLCNMFNLHHSNSNIMPNWMVYLSYYFSNAWNFMRNRVVLVLYLPYRMYHLRTDGILRMDELYSLPHGIFNMLCGGIMRMYLLPHHSAGYRMRRHNWMDFMYDMPRNRNDRMDVLRYRTADNLLHLLPV